MIEKGKFVVCALLMAGASVAHASDSPTKWAAPWSVNAAVPVTPEAAVVQKHPAPLPAHDTDLLKIALLGCVKFYQVGISPADGASCLFYPTCSGYSVLTLKKHGPILGFIMTSERVMRNHTGPMYPAIWKFGRWRNYDPVEANDYWFPGEKAKWFQAQAARRKQLEGQR